MVDNSHEFHISQRVSFKDTPHLCTICFIGPVAGATGVWLGVEWDDPTRGKHNGVHGGKRYFQCKSPAPTAASFVRPSRPTNPPLTFLEALHKKYASPPPVQAPGATPSDPENPKTENVIKFGSKTVEEVGFEKIRQQLAILHELKIVILDGMCIDRPGKVEEIRKTCPKITELDLGRNLWEEWEGVVEVVKGLPELRGLRINGNRFQSLTFEDDEDGKVALRRIKELSADGTSLTWGEITTLAAPFTTLLSLSAASNNLTQISPSLPSKTLTSLALERNEFASLSALSPLTALPNLQRLSLKNNNIRSVPETSNSPADLHFSETLTYVDISYNSIDDWSFIDSLQDVFPGLTGLRVAHNPLYEGTADDADEGKGAKPMGVEEGYMLTLARLRGLKTLNFSNIPPQERQNAELFYLSRIGKAVAAAPPSEEQSIIAQHRRYAELCDLHGEPTITRTSATSVNPNSLEARLITITFRRADTGQTIKQEIPKSIDNYRLKGIVGRLFDVRPLRTRLVWESDEWDPVGGSGGGSDWDSSGDEDDMEVEEEGAEGRRGKWMRREVELEDGTREVGFWIDGQMAVVRVEMKDEAV